MLVHCCVAECIEHCAVEPWGYGRESRRSQLFPSDAYWKLKGFQVCLLSALNLPHRVHFCWPSVLDVLEINAGHLKKREMSGLRLVWLPLTQHFACIEGNRLIIKFYFYIFAEWCAHVSLVVICVHMHCLYVCVCALRCVLTHTGYLGCLL